MSHILLLLALVAFLSGLVVSATQRGWVMVLLFAGLILLTLDQAGWIHS